MHKMKIIGGPIVARVAGGQKALHYSSPDSIPMWERSPSSGLFQHLQNLDGEQGSEEGREGFVLTLPREFMSSAD